MKFVRRNVNVTKEPLSTWQRTKSTQTTLNKIIARHATWRRAELWTWRMQKKINIMLRQKTTSMSRIDLTLWPSVCVYSQHSSGIVSEIWCPGKSVHVEVVYVSLINHFRSKIELITSNSTPPPPPPTTHNRCLDQPAYGNCHCQDLDILFCSLFFCSWFVCRIYFPSAGSFYKIMSKHELKTDWGKTQLTTPFFVKAAIRNQMFTPKR